MDAQRFEPRTGLGAIPLIFRTGIGQTRVAISASRSTVIPPGFSSSEAILDSSLFGVIADRARQPGRLAHGALNVHRHSPRARPRVRRTFGGGGHDRFGQVDVDLVDVPRSSISGAIARAASLNSRE